MGVVAEFGVLTLVVATVLQYTVAAPVTEFFGPPRTIEGEGNAHGDKKVEEMERFHRTYENGTVEFKMALSNGHVQYQKISKKSVDGEDVQVYEGYISEQYKDGRYGTRYYVADENGYRSSPVIVEDKPPKLPASGPYAAVSSTQDGASELPEENDQPETKPVTDNVVELRKDIEEEIVKDLNSKNTISTIESEILKHIQEEEHSILEHKINEEENAVLPSSTEGSLNLSSVSNLDSSSTTEAAFSTQTNGELEGDKISYEPSVPQESDQPSSTVGSLNLSSEISSDSVSTTESDISTGNQAELESDKISQDPKILQNTDDQVELKKGIEEEIVKDLNRKNVIPNIESEIMKHIQAEEHKVLENKISGEQNLGLPSSTEGSLELTSEVSLDSVTTTEAETLTQTEEDVLDNNITENPTVSDISSSTDSSSVLIEDRESATEPENPSTDVNIDHLLEKEADHEDDLKISAELPKPDNSIPFEQELIGRSLPDQTTLSPSTEEIEDLKEQSPESVENEGQITEQTAILKEEDLEHKTEVPESEEEKKTEEVVTVLPTEEILEVTTEISLGDDTLTEFPISLENHNQGIHNDVVEIDTIKIDDETSRVSTYPQVTESSEAITTEQPSLLNEDLEKSTEIPQIIDFSSKIEITTELPVEESTTVLEDEVNNEKVSRSLDISTEQPILENNSTKVIEGIDSEKDATTVASVDQNEDATTVMISDDEVTEKSSNFMSDLVSLFFGGDSSEKDSTEAPKESSENSESTAKVSEITTESEVIPTEKPEMEIYHPVFRS